jgi:hypothetical protein
MVGGAAMAACVLAFVTVLFNGLLLGSMNQFFIVILVLLILASILPGVLAAWDLATPRTVGSGAKAGAVAGLAGGATNAVLTLFLLQFVVKQLLPPQNYFSYLGDLRPALIDSFCVLAAAWIPVAVALSTVSGMLYAALKRR